MSRAVFAIRSQPSATFKNPSWSVPWGAFLACWRANAARLKYSAVVGAMCGSALTMLGSNTRRGDGATDGT
jgi:hypothetical protein